MDRYEEALERAKAGKPMDEVFPELKESEDERIRKALIKAFKEKVQKCFEWKDGIPNNAVLNWLEKQKENPKSADSIPSFCVSDVKWTDTIITRAIVALSDDVDYNRDEPCKYRREIDDLKKLRDVLCMQKEQKPVKLNDDTKVGLDRALQIVKDAKGNLCGYQSDDGIYECDHAIQTLERILKNGIEQKPVKWNDTDMKEARDNLISVCRDWERGEQTTLLPIVAVRARYFLEHLAEPKPAEWSEEDVRMLNSIIATCQLAALDRGSGPAKHLFEMQERFLKSLRPQPHWKPSEEQMEALNGAWTNFDSTNAILKTLYNDLKKLM